MDQIGIGVIAAGQMGQRHANVYRQLPEVQLRAVADLNAQAAHAAADPAGADAYADWRQLLERDDVHAVSICLPDWDHRDAVIATADAGKHILPGKAAGYRRCRRGRHGRCRRTCRYHAAGGADPPLRSPLCHAPWRTTGGARLATSSTFTRGAVTPYRAPRSSRAIRPYCSFWASTTSNTCSP